MVLGTRVIRALFVAADEARVARWIARVEPLLAVNAATAKSISETISHLSEEPVDVIVAGARLADGSRDELLAELFARHPDVPVIAFGGRAEDAVGALGRGAYDALTSSELGRLPATIVRALRDTDLARALRDTHD